LEGPSALLQAEDTRTRNVTLVTGLEPATSGVTGRHSNRLSYARASACLERAKGFEPSTPTLARLCSTPELHPHTPKPSSTRVLKHLVEPSGIEPLTS
jgi:hypothetical protein